MKRFATLLLLAALTSLSTVGCVSSTPPKRPLDYPISFIFLGSFDDVWNATVRVLDKYAITVANREAGQLQTDWSSYRSNPELYDHPDTNEPPEEIRYRLKIKLSKAYVTETKEPAVRVQIVKELEVYRNFYLDWVRVSTDLNEERVLLYRIQQKLRVERELKKLSQGSSTK
jgi:uncharacterized lipoprotein